MVVAGGLPTGLALGARFDLSGGGSGFNLPRLLPFGFPGKADFTFDLFALVLPQLPMTLGNAVLAYTDLSKEYFGNQSAKLTNRKACVSMALANFLCFGLGGMPLFQGASGLAAHYRFGARTAGSNANKICSDPKFTSHRGIGNFFNRCSTCQTPICLFLV